MKYIRILTLFIVLQSYLFPSVTGKISGVISDASSGKPLIGANVMLDGTSIGAATDIDGHYNILNKDIDEILKVFALVKAKL